MELNLWFKLESYLICKYCTEVVALYAKKRRETGPLSRAFAVGSERHFARIVPLPFTGHPFTCLIVALTGLSMLIVKVFCTFVVVPNTVT